MKRRINIKKLGLFDKNVANKPTYPLNGEKRVYMKKIEKLTVKQEKLVKVYRDKWLKNGIKTTRLNKKKAIEAVKTIYKCANKEEPKYFFFFPSPLQCQLAINILKQQKDIKDLLKDKANLRDNLWANLRANLGDNLWANLRANLGANLRANLRDNLWANLGDNLWANLRANLGANLGDNLKLEFLHMYYGNQEWDIGWAGFYDFILNELFEERIKEFPKFLEYLEAMKNIHCFIPYKDIVFISDNPTKLNINSLGRLHKDQEPALMYSDGYSLFYLNGIKVPKELVEVAPNKVTKEMIVKQPNADIRRELVRKVGSIQLLKILDYKVIDSKDEYELINFDIGDNRTRPFLKMICPSTKLIHIEGVLPTINKVEDALAYQFKQNKWKRPFKEA